MKIIFFVILNYLFVACFGISQTYVYRISKRKPNISIRCVKNCGAKGDGNVVLEHSCDGQPCPKNSISFVRPLSKRLLRVEMKRNFFEIEAHLIKLSEYKVEFQVQYRGKNTIRLKFEEEPKNVKIFTSLAKMSSSNPSKTTTKLPIQNFNTKATTISLTAPRSTWSSELPNAISNSNPIQTTTFSSIFKTTKQISFHQTSTANTAIARPILKSTTYSRPTYKIHCYANCPFAKTEEETTLGVICTPNCSLPLLEWTTKPVIPNIKYTDSNQKIVIPRNIYKENIIVTIISKIDEESLTYVIQFVPPPIIKLICVANCWNANYFAAIHVEARCIKYCYNGIFEWSVMPSINFKVYGPREALLAVPPMTLSVDIVYKISVTLNNRAKASDVLKVEICVLIPKTGISGKTKFRLQCPFDTYNETFIFQKTDPTSKDHGLLIYEGKGITKSNFYLMPGENTKLVIMIPSSHYVQNISVSILPLFNGLETNSQRMKLAEEYNKIESFLNDGINLEDIQRISAFLGIVRDANTEKLKYYTTKILKDLSHHSPEMSPLHAVTIISEIAKLDVTNDGFIKSLLSDSLLKIVNAAAAAETFSPYQLGLFASRVHEVASSIASKNDQMEKDLIVDGVGDDSDYKTHDETYYRRVSLLRHMKESTMNVITALEKIGTLKDTNNKPFAFVDIANGMTSTTQQLHKDDQIIQAKNIKSQISISKDAKVELNSEDAYVHMTLLQPNIFWWNSETKAINSEFVMINIYSNGQKVTELKKSHLDLLISSEADPFNFISIKGDLVKDVSIVHKIEIKSLTTLYFEFLHFGFDYTVLLSYAFPKTKEIKNKGFVIKNLTVYTRTMNNVNKNVYIGVARWLGDKPTYAINMKARKCLSFASNQVEWSPEHCTVGTDSNDSITHCICNHFSVFGASYFVPPNKIQKLSTMSFQEAVKNNAIMLYLAIAVIVLYITLLVFANHLDRRSEVSATVDHLLDNYPGYGIMYIVCIETPLFHKISTSRIIIEIQGEKSNSDRHFLNGRKHFSAGSEDWFYIFTLSDLGELLSIRLFHDSAGLNPSWYCDKVIIQRPDTANIYVFSVRKWFSPLHGNGITDRVIPLTVKSNIREGLVRMPYEIGYKFRDELLFASIFVRPHGSTFTSKERLTVTFVSILISMVTGAMFYGKQKSLDEVGTFGITMGDMSVYLQIMIITLPVGTILYILFKCSRPFKSH